jgi:hypothetical protein
LASAGRKNAPAAGRGGVTGRVERAYVGSLRRRRTRWT